MRKILFSLLVLLVLTACGPSQSQDTSNKIRIGVTPVPHAQLINLVKDDLAKEGIEVEVVEFNDYLVPNIALNDGDIDANFFQHLPFLDENMTSRNLDLASLGYVHIEPIALYSKKIKKLEDLKDGAQILIPNDPTNGSRALLLLHNQGLITLKDPHNFASTEKDIAENPHNFKFVAMEAAAIPSSLEDVDAAIINSNFAIKAGLSPSKDGLLMESKESPYANLVAVRAKDKDLDKFKKLMEALQSQKVKDFLEKEYHGEIYPAF